MFQLLLFSVNYNIKVLENIKQGFKRTIYLNKYISEITTQTKKKQKKQKTKLDYPIDPAFRDVNRLFIFSFRNGDDDPIKNSFDEYYVPLVKIKDFNVLIENTLFFDEPVKKETRSIWKAYWNVKKWWLYNRIFIRLSVSLKIL